MKERMELPRKGTPKFRHDSGNSLDECMNFPIDRIPERMDFFELFRILPLQRLQKLFDELTFFSKNNQTHRSEENSLQDRQKKTKNPENQKSPADNKFYEFFRHKLSTVSYTAAATQGELASRQRGCRRTLLIQQAYLHFYACLSSEIRKNLDEPELKLRLMRRVWARPGEVVSTKKFTLKKFSNQGFFGTFP